MSQSCFAEVFNESEKKDNRYEHGPAQRSVAGVRSTEPRGDL